MRNIVRILAYVLFVVASITTFFAVVTLIPTLSATGADADAILSTHALVVVGAATWALISGVAVVLTENVK